MNLKVKVIGRRLADDNHEVVSVEASEFRYMKKPCRDCPWRKDSVGVFPAEAFRLSADTSYDMSRKNFSCHSAGTEHPKMCAGFLLHGSDHNLSVRIARMNGQIGDDVDSAGLKLFGSYKEMAIANGVPEDDESLVQSRED